MTNECRRGHEAYCHKFAMGIYPACRVRFFSCKMYECPCRLYVSHADDTRFGRNQRAPEPWTGMEIDKAIQGLTDMSTPMPCHHWYNNVADFLGDYGPQIFVGILIGAGVGLIASALVIECRP